MAKYRIIKATETSDGETTIKFRAQGYVYWPGHEGWKNIEKPGEGWKWWSETEEPARKRIEDYESWLGSCDSIVTAEYDTETREWTEPEKKEKDDGNTG